MHDLVGVVLPLKRSATQGDGSRLLKKSKFNQNKNTKSIPT